MSENIQVNIVDEIAQVNVNNQVVQNPYKLPIASRERLGGIKPGENLEMTPDGTLNAKAGSSGGEVWEDIIPKYTIGTASNQILVPVETTKHYKKLQIIYRNNIATQRNDIYTYCPYMAALTSTTHTSEPLALAVFDASRDNTNIQSLMFDNGYLVSQIELVSDNIYITQSLTKLNSVADVASPQVHSESMFDDDGLLTGFILITPTDIFTDGFVAGGTIEIKGVAI